MSTGEAFTAFVGFQVKLPTGKTIRAQPLPWKKAVEYMARLTRWRKTPTYAGMAEELAPMLDEFADVVKLNDADRAAFEELEFLKAVDVIQVFFTLRSPGPDPEIVPEPEPPTSPEASPSPSST